MFLRKVKYICPGAKENRKFKEDWQTNHRRYYRIADITIQLDSDLPVTDFTFRPKFKQFEIDGPGEDTIHIEHHFSFPCLKDKNLGREIYHRAPWAIYKKNGSWIYLCIPPGQENKEPYLAAVFNYAHTSARIYSDSKTMFFKGNRNSLSFFPTDQILLARVLADREGCYLHACGVNFKGNGLLFAGQSEAGKSTIATILKGKAEILCDERVIIRRWPGEFKIYGTWSHGDVADISANSAPLKAILFLEKSDENLTIILHDKIEIVKRLLSCLIKPLVTADWWDKMFSLIEKISNEIPAYVLKFNKDWKIEELFDVSNGGVADGKEKVG